MTQHFDLIVVGAGPGGYVAAIKAAQLHKKVALIEARDLGGTCLNRGCIPTKTLIHAVETLQNLTHANEIGIKVGQVEVDPAGLHARVETVIQQLRDGVKALLQANNVEIIVGHGQILKPGLVRVGEVDYRAEKILIATGSVPARPNLPGIDLPQVLNSDELLASASKPMKRLLILGGGAIGVEFAGIYAALGTEVTIVEAQPHLLPALDREIGQSMSLSLKRRGVHILTSSSLQAIHETENALCCMVHSDGIIQERIVDTVLIAVGRKANTNGLLAAELNLELEHGQIKVDDDSQTFQTTIPGIYAVGDVASGSLQLAHAASAQGVNAVSAMFGEKLPYNIKVVPACIYSHPEIATVGLSEREAKNCGLDIKIGKYITTGNARSIIAQAERGFIKLVFDAKTEELLGAHLFCERATDLVGGLAQAIANRLTLPQLAATVFPHPTFAEGIGEAIENANGQAIHAMPKNKKEHMVP